MGTAQQEVPVDKIYVVFCRRSTDPYDPYMQDTWVESVHRTETGAQDCVRKCQVRQLREQLATVLKNHGDYSPELPLSWVYQEMDVKD